MNIPTSRGISPSRCKAMEAIVAVYSDWGIGSGGTQPVVLKADRAHFKELTDGAAVIVGRKTLGDFPGGRPLKGRHNIVVTRQDIEVAGAQVAHSTGEALTLAAEYERCLRPRRIPASSAARRCTGSSCRISTRCTLRR